MLLLLLSAVLTVATARPSYIAVPADQIAFLDLTRLHVRVPRQTLTTPQQLPQALYDDIYQPVPIQQYQQQPIAGLAPPPEPQHRGLLLQQQQIQEALPEASHAASARLSERPPDFGEYVDFGAHTGDHGAFGWYADYPINNHEDSSYRK